MKHSFPHGQLGTRPSRVWIVLLVWVSVFVSAVAPAQELHTELLTVDEGLPSSAIIDLHQDPSGRLWILDRLGVTVYDGEELTTFPHAGGMSVTYLGDLAIDATGGVWAVSGRNPSVYRLRGDRWMPLPAPPPRGLGDTAVFLEVLDDRGAYLVATATAEDGMWLWHQSRFGTFYPPERPHGSEGIEGISALTVFREPGEGERAGGKLAVGTADGLCFVSFQGRVDCAPRRRHAETALPILALEVEERAGAPDRLWMLSGLDRSTGAEALTRIQLSYLEGDETTVVAGPSQLRDLNLRAREEGIFKTLLLRDSAGGFYFGNSSTVAHLDPDRRSTTLLGVENGLAGRGATSFLLDREQNVWIASLRGLARIGSRRFLSYDEEHGLLEDEVAAVTEAEPGRMIFAHGSGLTFLENDELSRLEFGEFAGIGFRVLDMEPGPGGDVWLATAGSGVLRLDARRKTLVRETPEISAGRSLDRDPEGRLWLVTPDALYLRGSEGWELRHRPEGIKTARWLDISADGDFFVTTKYGLWVLRRGEEDWRWIHSQDPSSDNLYAVLARPSGEVWLGSAVGAFILRNDSLEPVTEEGFQDLQAPVYCLFEDQGGRLWLGTDDGVRIWDGSELRQLTVRHGLKGRETNRGAGFVDARGRVWIGTDRGVSVYREVYDRRPAAPKLELLGVDADGVMHSLDHEISLNHERNTLVFKFRTVTFSDEEELLVRYRLEGFDAVERGPVSAASSEVRYTNLEPGRYVFHIRAGRRGGAWTREQSSSPVVLRYPFWRTYSFYGFVLLLAVGSGSAVYLLRTRAVRRRAFELEEVNRKLRHAAEERERLIAGLEAQNLELERFNYTVSHDLKSPLFTIQGFLGFIKEARSAGNDGSIDRDLEQIEEATDRMARLLDELLELAQVGQVLHSLESIPLAALIDEALRLAAGRLRERHVTVDVDSSLGEVYGDRARLRMVFQNLIDNAVKFTFEQAEPRITVSAETRGDRTEVTVADNGVGIEPDQQEAVFGLFKRLEPRIPGTGVGLALVRRIVEAHGGEVWVESEGRGHGSRFVVSLPVPPTEAPTELRAP